MILFQKGNQADRKLIQHHPELQNCQNHDAVLLRVIAYATTAASWYLRILSASRWHCLPEGVNTVLKLGSSRSTQASKSARDKYWSSFCPGWWNTLSGKAPQNLTSRLVLSKWTFAGAWGFNLSDSIDRRNWPLFANFRMRLLGSACCGKGWTTFRDLRQALDHSASSFSFAACRMLWKCGVKAANMSSNSWPTSFGDCVLCFSSFAKRRDNFVLKKAKTSICMELHRRTSSHSSESTNDIKNL